MTISAPPAGVTAGLDGLPQWPEGVDPATGGDHRLRLMVRRADWSASDAMLHAALVLKAAQARLWTARRTFDRWSDRTSEEQGEDGPCALLELYFFAAGPEDASAVRAEILAALTRHLPGASITTELVHLTQGGQGAYFVDVIADD